MSIPWSQIHQQGHQQGPQRPPAHLASNYMQQSTFENAFPSAPPPPPHLGSVPRTQQFAEVSEYYTWERVNHQQQYPPNQGGQRAPTAPVLATGSASGRRLPVKNNLSQHHQQQRQPRPTLNQHPSHSHPHPQHQERKNYSSSVDTHGADSPSTGENRTPQRSIHGTPNHSRRGSSMSTNGALQCHYKNCGKRFASDHEWREHKTHCRCRDYQMTSGFQCSFVGCKNSPNSEAAAGRNSDQQGPDTNTPHSPCFTYGSLLELLAHEREHHQILFCVDCQQVFPGSETEKADEHRQTCAAHLTGRTHNRDKFAGLEIGLGLQRSLFKGSGVHQGAKIRCLWVKDIQKTLNNKDRQERAYFVDLAYPERPAEERGEQPDRSVAEQFGNDESNNPPGALSGTVRSAMARQLIGTLKLHNDFLTSASEVVLELTLQEKDEVREYLISMANLLRIELNTAGSPAPSIGQANPVSQRGSVSGPVIQISTEVASTAQETRTYAQTVRTGLQIPKVESSCEAEAEGMNPSNEPERSRINPHRILSRSNSPSRAASTDPASSAAQSQIPPEAQGMGSSPAPAPPEVLEPHLPASALKRAGTNTVVVTTEEGEPLQETHIPREEQYVYFVQMMNCCLHAVYEWFERNREILLENCECNILNSSHFAEGSQGAHTPEGVAGAGPTGCPTTKQQKRRLKKRLAAATADASGSFPPNNPSTTTTTTPGDGPPARPSVCLLHTVTSVNSLNLPRWTNHLRRLVEHERIPSSIISNRESFSGEIQPVDEVRHAVIKKKEKPDRDLLALVQQARKFCWQLKDWERCRQLDELYCVLEDKINLVKGEEGWETAKGSMRGKKARHVRSDLKKVMKVSARGGAVGDNITTGEDTEVGRMRSVVKQSFTWPRMLGSNEITE